MPFIRVICVCFVVVACAANHGVACGQDNKNEQKTKASPFALPANATTAELGAFLKSLRTRQANTIKEKKQRVVAIYQASSAILKGKPDPELEVMATDARLMTLTVMPQAQEGFKGPTPLEFAKEVAKNSNPRVALIGKHYELDIMAGGVLKMKPKELRGYLEECFALATTHGVDVKTFTLLNTKVGRALEKAGRNKDASSLFERLAPMVSSSRDPRLSAYKSKLEGSVRRLRLIGKPIELKGTTDSGQAFDWSAYKGKVVLVDFWATWCDPCTKEMPNMIRNYNDFHDKGFEIVGVNLDNSPERFRKFVSKRELPWAHIMGTKEKFGWDQPVAAYYGISSLPTQMLVGRDGKVISINLRGRALDLRLEQLFGGRPKKDPGGSGAAKR